MLRPQAPEPAAPDSVTAKKRPDLINYRNQVPAVPWHQHPRSQHEEPVEQRYLKRQQRVAAGDLIAEVGQQPVLAAGDRFNSQVVALSEVDERRAYVAQDNPANQDDPQLGWTESTGRGQAVYVIFTHMGSVNPPHRATYRVKLLA